MQTYNKNYSIYHLRFYQRLKTYLGKFNAFIRVV